MPIVTLPDGRRVQFPEGMDTSAMQAEIEKAFPEFSAPSDMNKVLDQPPVVSSQTSPVTGQAEPTLGPSKGIQPLPTTLEASIKAQQPAGGEIPAEIGAQSATVPRFGEEGTWVRGVSDVASGLAEWALNKPEEALASLTPLAPAIAMYYGPSVVKQFTQDAIAGVRGDRQALGRAMAMGALVAGGEAVAKWNARAAEVKGEAEGRAAEPTPVPVEPTPPPPVQEAIPKTVEALKETGEGLLKEPPVAPVAETPAAPKVEEPPPTLEPLGLDRPVSPDPTLKALTDEEFRTSKKANQWELYDIEGIYDEKGDAMSPTERSKMGQLQDKFSAFEIEAYRRRFSDQPAADVFHEMLNLSDNLDPSIGLNRLSTQEDFHKFSALAEILGQSGPAELADKWFTDYLTRSPDAREVYGYRYAKVKELMGLIRGGESPATPGLSESAPPGLPPASTEPPPAEPTPPPESPVPQLIGISDATVDIQRADRGLPPIMAAERLADPVLWDRATAAVQSDPTLPSRLTQELLDNPRPMTDTEGIIMARRLVELTNNLDQARWEGIKATDAIKPLEDQLRNPLPAEEKASIQGQISELQSKAREADVRAGSVSDSLSQVEQAIGRGGAGTEMGRAFRARQLLLREDFSLAGLERQMRGAKGFDRLTPDELATARRTAEEFKAKNDALEARLAEANRLAAQANAAKELAQFRATEAEAKAAVTGKVKAVVERVGTFLDTRADAARERLRGKLFTLSPDVLADLAEIGASNLYHIGMDLAKWSAKMVEDLGERVRPHLDELWEASKKLLDESIKSTGSRSTRSEKPATEGELSKAREAIHKRLRNRIADYEERIKVGDYSQVKRERTAPDPETLRLQAELERVKQKWQRGLEALERAQLPRWQRIADAFVRWERAFKLSSPVVFGKLTAAALTRVVTTGTEEAIGGVASKLPGINRIAAEAPREGGISVKAMAKAVTAAMTKGMRDAAETARSGASNLDVLFGQKLIDQDWANFFGQLHGALKAPVKRAEFELSLEKRVQHAIAHGIDVTDPMIQTRLSVEALDDAYRSIFMQKNVASDAFNVLTSVLESSKRAPVAGPATAKLLRFLLPIVRVPTNIVGETLQGATGSVTGTIKLLNVLRKGIDSIPEKDRAKVADGIMRDLKKGSIGLALMTIGYMNPQAVGGYDWREKRKPGAVKTGGFQVLGEDIPRWMTHAPWFELLQIGATVRHVKEQHVKGVPKGMGEGVWAAGLGLIEETPFVNEMIHLNKVFEPEQRDQFLGEMAKGTLVPQGLAKIAELTDSAEARKPKTVLQHVETGIPGLRQNVPVKKTKGALYP